MPSQCHRLSITVVAFVLLTAGCSSGTSPHTAPSAAPAEPRTVASTRIANRGFPNGASGSHDPYPLAERSVDPTYGHAPSNPIRVGGDGNGSHREQRYLSSLRGPTGEPITYERSGSCCGFETPNSALGGMLDVYVITYPGQPAPITLYLNMYDPGPALIPVGFTPY